MNQADYIFPSKRDWWLGAFIWGIMLITFFITVQTIQHEEVSLLAHAIVYTIWIPLFLLIGVVWFGTKYIVSEEWLVIMIGPIIVYRINILSIRSIRRSNSLMSAPANSLDRLEIAYGRRQSVMVSPMDADTFVGVLKDINQEIEINLR